MSWWNCRHQNKQGAHKLKQYHGRAMGIRSIEEFGEMIEARVSKVLRERDEQVSEYSLSDLNSEMQGRIMRKMQLQEEIIAVDEPVDESVPVYKWKEHIAENADGQRTEYMQYLRTHLASLLQTGSFFWKTLPVIERSSTRKANVSRAN